jgi:hypothetical protein
MLPYRHTQAGTVVRWALLAGLLPLPTLLWLPASPFPIVVPVAGLPLLSGVLVLLLWSLTVEVTPAHFKFWFGPGLIGKAVPLALVTACEPVDGIRAWGIHWAGKRGWLYNVSGWRAVAVTLADGRRFMVGTDEPEQLCQAVAEARAQVAAVDAGAY